MICNNNGVPCAIAAPSRLFNNLGHLPIDTYTAMNNTRSGGELFIAGCAGNRTVRSCVQEILAAYAAQNVSGIRFFVGLDFDEYSTPLTTTSPVQVRSEWVSNLGLFFQDMAASGIAKAVPTIGFIGQNVNLAPITSACSGGPVVFSRVTPFGFTPRTDQNGQIVGAEVPEGVLINECYRNEAPNTAGGKSNPYFVGWRILVGTNGLIDQMLAQAQNFGIEVFELDMENELNVHSFPITGRLIVDTSHGLNAGETGQQVDVYQLVMNRMAAHGFQAGRVTYSAAEVNPQQAYAALISPPYPDTPLSSSYAYSVDLLKQNTILNPPFDIPSGSFVPSRKVTCADAAMLILRSIQPSMDVTNAQDAGFQDVGVNHPYRAWINRLRELGITNGCTANPDNYCPDTYINNEQLAVFVIRAWLMLKRGTVDYFFSYPQTPSYADVDASHNFFPYIQKLKELEISGDTGPGCTPWMFCGGYETARGDTSVWLARGPLNKTSGQQFFCYSPYGDSARLIAASALHAAIRGQTFGVAPDEDVTRAEQFFQNCGYKRPTGLMTSVPHSAPAIVDVHARPCVSTGNPNEPCRDTTTGSPTVLSEALQTFNDFHAFLTDRWGLPTMSTWPVVHIGEAWETNSPPETSCTGGGAQVRPANAAAISLQGYNSSKLAGKTLIVFDHWGIHTNVECNSPFPSFTVNPPYQPSQF